MATLSSIRKQISALEKKAEELVKKESAQAIAKARELIERYGLTAENLGLSGDGKKAGKTAGTRVKRGPAKKSAKNAKTIGIPMYRDPETGKTWTGRGKPPAWIAGAQDRSPFLIAPSAATASATEEAQPAVKKGRSTKKPARGGKRASAKAAAEPRAEASTKTARKTARKATAPRRGPAPRKAAGRKPAAKASRKSKPVSAPVQTEGGSDAS
jgi:DNA-binding protein H-NS